MTAPDRAKAQRLLPIDAWRFIAAVAIVWLHTCSDGYLAASTAATRFAVPFFSAAAMFLLYLSIRRKPETKFPPFLARRVQRLYFPFLAWSAIYFASSNLKRHYLSHRPPVPFGPSFFWVGTSQQLWFLPFLLAATLGGFWICRGMTQRTDKSQRGMAMVLTLIGLIFCFIPMPWYGLAALGDDVPATRYLLAMTWDTLPAVFWGLAFAAISWRPPAWIGLSVFLAAIAALFFVGRNSLLENLAGVAVLASASADWDSPLIRKLAQFGPDAYGIYLAHVLFIQAMFTFAQRAKIPNSIPLKLAEFAVALLASYALVRLLHQSRWTRWING